MSLQIELLLDGEIIPQVDGVFILDNISLYDFGRTFQFTLTNRDLIPLKNHYIKIVGDSSHALYGEEYKFASLTHIDGSGETKDKLWLLNNNIETNQSEQFQLKMVMPYGVDDAIGLKVQLCISNHLVNEKQYEIIS